MRPGKKPRLSEPCSSTSASVDAEMEDINETNRDQNEDGQINSANTSVTSHNNGDNNDGVDDVDDDDDDDGGGDVSDDGSDDDSDDSSDQMLSGSDSDILESSSEEAADNIEEAAMQVSSFLIRSELEEVQQFLNLVSHALEVISSHVLRSMSMSTGRLTSALEDLQNIVHHLLAIQSGQREE
ncbi:Flap endonuclease 1 [Frankliniella fusca]|uniref:Flap endonuclease 1 n=1 Tax=Frankliniella fusca TaxID=407009 RepID=A0AAE1LGY9_9NEOP|nr:Flap endonuclease 1 [Frankliniella fusca]